MTADSEETTCANCGAAVSKRDWHPATVETTASGDTVIRAFCSEPCREQWTGSSADAAVSQPDTTAD